ncbi:alcohol dehydrogenase catalytic domain-containing protein [bacterium]|nr:alcohol dehydrogenase catalytic domain-containing protein [bacterium]
MKILQVTGQREYEVKEVPTPTPGEGEVLLRIEAVTTCPQWDLHLRHNEPMFVGHHFEYPYTPGQPGHEATGVLEAVGPGVTDLKPGDRVCAWRDAGHHRWGCYAQYVVHDARNVIKVPEDLPVEAVAPLELAMCVATVFRMLHDMDCLKGRRVGIGGLGPAGLVALQMARAEGATEVYGFDLLEDRREMAVTLGVDGSFDPTADLSAEFPSRPAGPRLQTSVDCVGLKVSVEALMDRTADVVALFGVQREDYTFAVRHHSLRLCGYKGHSRESAEYAAALIRERKLNLAPLVTHKLPLEKYGEGIDLLEQRKAIKVCFMPWE